MQPVGVHNFVKIGCPEIVSGNDGPDMCNGSRTLVYGCAYVRFLDAGQQPLMADIDAVDGSPPPVESDVICSASLEEKYHGGSGNRVGHREVGLSTARRGCVWGDCSAEAAHTSAAAAVL
jgi:hypothetical protein